MRLYTEILKQVKDGDSILTTVNATGTERVVLYKDGRVKCKEFWFHWDWFFEVNTPIKIISDSSAKICPDVEQLPTEVEPNNSGDAPSV